MKCNMNKTTNNMANVYGPEFDMSTEEIINTIRKIVKLETVDQTFNPIDVEITLYNNDYYVRPGISKIKFMNESRELFEAIKPYRGKIDDDFLHFGFAIEMLAIIKRFFDETYFEEQVERRKKSEAIVVDKGKLKMYLMRLNRDKLEMFLNMVVTYRRQYGLFVTDISSSGFWAKINELCIEAGLNVPNDLGSTEAQSFLNNNKNYYFKMLSSKTIANVLCDAIDLDIEMATAAAKKLYNSGYEAMIRYIRHNIV